MVVDLEKHERVKYLLRTRGTSFAKIAKALGVSQGNVTMVSQGHRRSRRIQAEIARCLGQSPEELFPDRYPAEEGNKS